MDQKQDRVVVIGGRVGGNLAAAYLKRKNPDLDVLVVDRPNNRPPLVGESTIEGTTLFLHECGLSKLLQEKHFHKFGLTFYFKMDPKNPSDRRYAIHEEPAIPPLPAALVNRWTFDRDVRALNEENGVRYVNGVVQDVDVKRGGHRVKYKDDAGKEHEVEARWIVDASGRHRVLGKKLDLHEKNEYQRCTYFFRLADFDRQILLDLNKEMRSKYPSMREQIAYDPYFVTHHFMGDGNWIWLIPCASEDGSPLISIGITYRPDVYPYGTVKNHDDFLANVDKEHPVVTALVRSGRVIEDGGRADTNVLINYMYHTKQHHSRDGWFVVGDAANAVDPLYSSGMFLISIEVMQANAIITADRKGTLTDEYVHDLDMMISTLYRRAQTIISRHYEVMADPVQSAARMHWMTTIYFYFGLPFFMCNYHIDPVGVKLMTKLMLDSEKSEKSAWELFGTASQKLGKVEPEDVFNWYNDTINYRLITDKENELPLHLARLSFLNARMRLATLKNASWQTTPRQVADLARDVTQGVLLRTLFRGASLKKSDGFRKLLGV